MDCIGGGIYESDVGPGEGMHVCANVRAYVGMYVCMCVCSDVCAVAVDCIDGCCVRRCKCLC